MASRIFAWTGSLFGAVALWACYDGAAAADADGDGVPGGGAAASSDTKAGGASKTAPGSDLSCELASFFAEHCQSCHGAKPVKGTTLSLLGRADLVAKSAEDPSKTVADEVLERLKDKDAPMPPAPEAPASAAEIGLVEAWIRAGTPVESCAAAETPVTPPPANDPFATASVCSSNKRWTKGDQGSDDMHPGKACLSCHKFPDKAFFKASFDIAGTVYPTGHEPDDCYGATGVTVVITDAKGVETKLDVSAAGNFGHSSNFGFAKIAMPYRAKVVRNGVERVMKDPQTNGDCNHCHSENGAEKAPGRIMAP